MLHKSTSSSADTLIYDLEDSVAPNSKAKARSTLSEYLQASRTLRPADKTSIRINDFTSPYFLDDVKVLTSLPPGLASAIVIPKVEDISVLDHIAHYATTSQPWAVIASIESARALWNIGSISSYVSDKAKIVALLFAAEDYCASTSIIRSRTRQELLYVRSQIVTAARAFGLQAIDMVNVNYQDKEYHAEECRDGRTLGFDGKQAIHPSQVEIINATFRPTDTEILRAAKIVHRMSLSHASGSGAFGLEQEGQGGREMIDAPMVKQAQRVIMLAKLCGIEIPDVGKNT